MKTSVVIPTWNRPELLARCVAAVHEHTEDDYELIVIDNGSEPRGWTWAANRGMRAAEGEVVVLLNDDCIVEPGWLPPLRVALETERHLWAVSATDPEGDNWPLNPWALALLRHRGEVTFDDRYIHFLSDCEFMERAKGHYRRVEESHVRHVRSGEKSPVELTTLRSWHLHDYGELPGW